jgi:VanZ family protein
MKLILPNSCVFAAVAAGVLSFALAPAMPFDMSLGGSVQHIFAFTVLASLAFFFWPNAIPQLIWSGLVGFGGLIELLQGWMALGRQAEWTDWFVDIIAVSLTMAVIGAVRLVRNVRTAEPA